MNSSASRKKFNPWPYALICFFVFFISITVGFIVFAVGQDMDLVREDYYEAEMRFQQQIDRENRALALRDQVAITYEPAGQTVGIQLPVEHARKSPKGSIQFYRPSNASLDHQVTLDLGEDGRQHLTVAALAAGLWNLSVLWEVDGQEYFTKKAVVIGARP